MICHVKRTSGPTLSGIWNLQAIPEKVMVITLSGIMVTLLSWNSPAVAEEAAVQEEQPSTTLGEDVTPMDKSFQRKPIRPGYLLRTLKEQLKDAPPFIRDMNLGFNLRTYFAYTDNLDDTKNEAWTLGGSFSYQSGWFLDHVGIGATLYTSQPLYAPDDRDGTILLEPGQDGYTVAGELYGRVKVIDENFINIYRYRANSPYLNENDSRMTPNTFEGYTFSGATRGKDGAPTFIYGGGYIDKIKPRNSDTFISMSTAAGASVNRGVVLGGADASFTRFSIGVIDYYSDDIINIGYTEAKYSATLTDNASLTVTAQYTDQRSVGDNLLKGYYFKTSQRGVKSDLSYGGSILTLAYTSNSRGADLQNPWSSYPGYTSVQVESFNRAGENAFMLKGSYDFSSLGLRRVTFYGLWVHGWGAVTTSTGGAVYQQDEYDADLQWLPQVSGLKGLWFRVRYAHVDQHGGGDATANDFRVIVNYDLSSL